MINLPVVSLFIAINRVQDCMFQVKAWTNIADVKTRVVSQSHFNVSELRLMLNCDNID